MLTITLFPDRTFTYKDTAPEAVKKFKPINYKTYLHYRKQIVNAMVKVVTNNKPRIWKVSVRSCRNFFQHFAKKLEEDGIFLRNELPQKKPWYLINSHALLSDKEIGRSFFKVCKLCYFDLDMAKPGPWEMLKGFGEHCRDRLPAKLIGEIFTDVCMENMCDRTATEQGHFNVVKYLWDNYRDKLSDSHIIYAFDNAYLQNYFQIVQFLWAKEPILLYDQLKLVFINSEVNLGMQKWAWLKVQDILSDRDYKIAFQRAMTYGQVESMDWLWSKAKDKISQMPSYEIMISSMACQAVNRSYKNKTSGGMYLNAMQRAFKWFGSKISDENIFYALHYALNQPAEEQPPSHIAMASFLIDRLNERDIPHQVTKNKEKVITEFSQRCRPTQITFLKLVKEQALEIAKCNLPGKVVESIMEMIVTYKLAPHGQQSQQDELSKCLEEFEKWNIDPPPMSETICATTHGYFSQLSLKEVPKIMSTQAQGDSIEKKLKALTLKF